MNSDTLKGDWKILRGKAQKQWGKISNDQWDIMEGSREQLAGAIQKSYGVARDEAEKQVRDWEKSQAA